MQCEMSHIVLPLFSHHEPNPTNFHHLSQILPVCQSMVGLLVNVTIFIWILVYMSKFFINMTYFIPYLTRFVLNMHGFVQSMNDFVLNVTVLVLTWLYLSLTWLLFVNMTFPCNMTRYGLTITEFVQNKICKYN